MDQVRRAHEFLHEDFLLCSLQKCSQLGRVGDHHATVTTILPNPQLVRAIPVRRREVAELAWHSKRHRDRRQVVGDQVRLRREEVHGIVIDQLITAHLLLGHLVLPIAEWVRIGPQERPVVRRPRAHSRVVDSFERFANLAQECDLVVENDKAAGERWRVVVEPCGTLGHGQIEARSAYGVGTLMASRSIFSGTAPGFAGTAGAVRASGMFGCAPGSGCSW